MPQSNHELNPIPVGVQSFTGDLEQMNGTDQPPMLVDILITPDEVGITVVYSVPQGKHRRETVLDMIAAAMALSLSYDVPLYVNEEEEPRG